MKNRMILLRTTVFLFMASGLLLPLSVWAQTSYTPTEVEREAPVDELSALLFPALDHQAPVFVPTDKIQIGYLDVIAVRRLGKEVAPLIVSDPSRPIPDRVVLFSEGIPYFRLQWQLPDLKRIAVFNLDATRAAYQCCQTSSMEYESCFRLPSLIAGFDFTRGEKIAHRVFRARHAFAAFDKTNPVESRLLVRAQTFSGQYFERQISLYYRVTSIHNRCR